MTGVRLFARTRRWGLNLGVMLAAAVLVAACASTAIGISADGAKILVAMAIPVVPAISIAASLSSSLAGQERLAARNIARWDVIHAVSLTCALLVVLGLSALSLPSADDVAQNQAGISLWRNAIALTGASLIGYRALGPRMGWAVAVIWVVLPPQMVSRPWTDPVGLFTLTTQPDASANALAWAIMIWVAGVASLTVPTRGLADAVRVP
ncbi:MAG: hypothetical protein P0Y48_11060 [Candidatus Microbacterium phytovorans]|uniref:Uncharacterized protein n=1 Tax=Candidatus Microbacterium phytovorans TaxID=3121374 RepID=A0AAJ6B3C7_9MICO|nr:hypothetical protein [Microbacterium sp.]WEK12997.1 MAG: hypothetical protein P0Y48_11060 [Microbacterium sp.]